MPYIHRSCGGVIKWYPPLPIPPRCTKCKKVWNPLVIYGLTPKDMYFQVSLPKVSVGRGDTSYAKWGDNIPFVGIIASRLPNWPRWTRILSLSILVASLVLLVYFLLGGFS